MRPELEWVVEAMLLLVGAVHQFVLADYAYETVSNVCYSKMWRTACGGGCRVGGSGSEKES